jgi:hypothetical protein
MNNVQERLIGGTIAPFVGEMSPGIDGSPQSLGAPIGKNGPDSLSLLRRPAGDTMTGGPMSIVSQLISLIQQLLSSFGQTYFENATASSTGDPHLAFDGNDGRGNGRHAHFDSMHGHSDLLDSTSFAGGYRISTKVTQPDANGVTYNRAASVLTNFGDTRVSLDNQGNAGVTSNGRTFSLAKGQTMDLGNGETVTRNADGSLIVTDDNGMGGSITTRLSENGAGVDVNVQAQNVALGGDLVNSSGTNARRVL